VFWALGFISGNGGCYRWDFFLSSFPGFNHHQKKNHLLGFLDNLSLCDRYTWDQDTLSGRKLPSTPPRPPFHLSDGLPLHFGYTGSFRLDKRNDGPPDDDDRKAFTFLFRLDGRERGGFFECLFHLASFLLDRTFLPPLILFRFFGIPSFSLHFLSRFPSNTSTYSFFLLLFMVFLFSTSAFLFFRLFSCSPSS